MDNLNTQAPFTLAAPFRGALRTSPTLQINERINEMWTEGVTVYHFGFGESRFPVHPKIQAALRQHAHQKSYLSAQGLSALRAQIADFYGRQLNQPVDAAQVMVGPGSKALLYALQMALDMHLILPTPSWVSYAPQARMLNRPVHFIPASPGEDYVLTLTALDGVVRAIGDAPKLLLLNSPSNPTGRMLDAAQLDALADYCRRHQIFVLSDEIYALTTHGHKPHLSMAQYYPEGTVVLSGLSKHLSLGGWRLGIAIVPAHESGAQLLHALRVIASEIWSTPTAPVQHAAISAYGDDPAVVSYIAECARIHAIRTQHLWAQLRAMGVACGQPDGGFYLFPNFDRWRSALAAQGVHTSDDLAHLLLERYQIATLPGTAFGAPSHDLSVRMATSYVDMETDAQAQALLHAYRENPDPNALLRDHHPHLSETIERLGDFVTSLTD